MSTPKIKKIRVILASAIREQLFGLCCRAWLLPGFIFTRRLRPRAISPAAIHRRSNPNNYSGYPRRRRIPTPEPRTPMIFLRGSERPGSNPNKSSGIPTPKKPDSALRGPILGLCGPASRPAHCVDLILRLRRYHMLCHLHLVRSCFARALRLSCDL